VRSPEAVLVAKRLQNSLELYRSDAGNSLLFYRRFALNFAQNS